jgi:hypothetical protein
MVTQRFSMPSYLSPVPMVGLVELFCFMFFGHDWESDNLVGFNNFFVEYGHLSPFDGNLQYVV